MLKIGITGNIASGKSQVEKILSNLGYTVYDSDEIAHKVLDEINNFYGYNVFTSGKIDRKKLGELVFSNPELKKKLEELTHPKIKSEIIKLFDEHKNDKLIFVSVPLLYEAKFDGIFDKVLLITVDNITQLHRLIKRNNYTQEEALTRINSQMPQHEKEKRADYIINNNSTIENLEYEVKKFITSIC